MLEFGDASNVKIAENLITTETDMTTTTKLTANLAIAVGVITTIALSAATPSLAQDMRYYDPSGNGSSQYQGYQDGRTVQRPSHRSNDYNSRARAPASGNQNGAYINRNRAPVDDPPGSNFQTYGNDHDDMGCPC